ncbi:MAG TPA: hypothetical protein VLH81_03040 [Desulfobacterales bacterium]|nr:hypothetical protein [Desulfobacterales bacterium]
MNQRLLRLVVPGSALLLLASIFLGFIVLASIHGRLRDAGEFLRSQVAGQSAFVSRVYIALERYRSPAGGDEQRVERCRQLVSHAAFIPVADARDYRRFIADDPLMLAPQIEAAEREYRQVVDDLAHAYDEIAATEPSAAGGLLAAFDRDVERLVQALDRRGRIIEQVTKSYIARLRADGERHLRQIRLVQVGQCLAAVLSGLLVALLFRLQARQVKMLEGMIPICASCKKVRDDRGYWSQVEAYFRSRSLAEFTHSICPDCMKELYPEYADELLNDEPHHE